MRQIEKEIVTKSKQVVYVANDNTEFVSKEECEKYEKSAKGVLMAKYSSLVVKETFEWELFNAGCDDNAVDIVKVQTQKDADLISQILLLENSYYSKDENKGKREKVLSVINDAIGDFLFIGRGYDRDSFWIIGSRKGFIKKFNEISDEPSKES